jgi:hypothetical protein
MRPNRHLLEVVPNMLEVMIMVMSGWSWRGVSVTGVRKMGRTGVGRRRGRTRRCRGRRATCSGTRGPCNRRVAR